MVLGVGSAGHHHGEILQGALRRGGELVSCLITMPVEGVGSRVRYLGVGRGGPDGPAGADRPDGSDRSDGLDGSDGPAEPFEARGPEELLDARGAVAAQAAASGRWRPVGPGQFLDAVPPLILDVGPALKTKAARAARLALDAIGAPAAGLLEVECSVATGVGLGSSTCDVVAAIRAVCNAHGVDLDAAQVARLAIEAEGAADPIMFDGEMVLFAQRQGRVLESFGSWMPPYAVLSIDTDPGGAGVDTLSLPMPRYTDAELAAFEDMVGRARQAFRQRDPVALAAVATESAVLNQRFVPLRYFREIRDLAVEYGALGVQIAHSGTIAGILFDARLGPADGGCYGALVDEVTVRLRSLGLRPRGLFTTGADH
jgi:uncharacterized protein involved in propanediol utilization